MEIEHGKLKSLKRRRARNKDTTGAPDSNDKFHEASGKAAHHRVT